MIIKEAFLESEYNRINDFLSVFSLRLDNDVNKSFYIEDNEKIIGTISCADYIIKCLAVDSSYQSENIASSLVNHIMAYLNSKSIYSYQVFTKPTYINIFKSLGFRQIIQTDKVVMLESGIDSIDDVILKLKKQLEIRFSTLNEESDLSAVVLNANPITNGHMHLIETASRNHKMVVVFVVEENKSEFAFEQRLAMVYLATKRFENVYVLPSTKYIVSSLTFPSYFLKEDEVYIEHANIDALIFKNYFIKNLHIKKRYIGTESKEKMIFYNNTLKNILNDKVVEINRLEQDNNIVSASHVRNLFKENKLDEALKYIPREIHLIVKSIVQDKYGK